MSKRHIVKKSTVDQIQKLIQEHGVSGMMDTTEYKNMSERNYLNKLEKENLRTIIALVNDGKDYDEIRFIIEGGEVYNTDPVAEATEDFMISMSKVVLSDPPEIIIGGVDDSEESPEEVERVEVEETEANDNTVQDESEANNVILLKDIIDKKNNTSQETEENNSVPTWDPPKYTKRQKKQKSSIVLPCFYDMSETLRKYY